MEKERTYTYQGYTLYSEKELAEVKKEAEAIHYIRSQADLNDIKVALRVYNRLIEKETLVTVYGVAFLQELRDKITESGVVAESSLKKVPAPKRFRDKELKEATRDQKLLALYKERCRNLWIVIVALAAVIVIMFVIRLTGTNSPFIDYEKKVLNEYGGWQDELNAKEEQLHAWELELLERENALAERENNGAEQ